MDALVYEDTPLATYFEGEALPFDVPHEETPPTTPFAPRGLPDLKDRLRTIRRRATGITKRPDSTEQLLERFHYVIVASQLLADEGGPRPTLAENDATDIDNTTLRGTAITATVSFLAAWAIHWIRTRRRITKGLTWIDVGSYSVGIVLFALVASHVGRWQYVHYLQKSSVKSLSRLLDDSHGFDVTATDAVRFIQEVEVVARGYDLGYTLPPISRIEDRSVVRRCQTLRRELATTLRLMTVVWVEGHGAIQQFISSADVQRYLDIYEVSVVEYSQATELISKDPENIPDSLKELRFSLQLHALARRVFLCDLLALRHTKGWTRVRQWRLILQVLHDVGAETTNKQANLSTLLTEEEWGNNRSARRSIGDSSQSGSESNQEDPAMKVRLRRFEDIAYSVRALNAKIHLIREEISGLTGSNSEESVIGSSFSKHYESLGSDLRNLLSEWERGKNIMLLNADLDHERISCSSSSIRTPPSPSSSFGGVHIVDGGPADALRLLNGDSPSSPLAKDPFEEEVFEAVASRLPRKRVSMGGMTREEKIAKLQEERRKRATMQEQADNTTSMLRELQMVIKHRPKGAQPSNRVASL